MVGNKARSDANEYTNYVSYRDRSKVNQSRIGHLDLKSSMIQPLSFKSGTPISNLYQVIEAGETGIKPSGNSISLSSVDLLPPISGRDVLAVGKNYAEHAKEFNSSGYDSSDKVDQPTHPVIFTKRSTSIIAHEDTILPHEDFTGTLDYEGEIGVIIRKGGYRIAQADAWDYVWGYTIINDITARERQRDHKQFYIGKSADTFCPMGPIAVPAGKLPKTLRVETAVNGEKRQSATTDDLIFSIPFLIETLSEGTTLQPGDVIATGTPAGVGFGQKPPVFLKPGDVVEMSVTGLGVLRNTVAEHKAENKTISRVAESSQIPVNNLSKTSGGVGLTAVGDKKLFYRHIGSVSNPPVIFIHGLGTSSEFFTPLISIMRLGDSHSLHLLDLEGHGLSPTSAASIISIESYARDFEMLAQQAGISSATVIAHDMGCVIAMALAEQCSALVSKLVLLGPPSQSTHDEQRAKLLAREETARTSGLISIADEIFDQQKVDGNAITTALLRISLLGQDPEGYAKGCAALAGYCKSARTQIKAKTLIIAGDQDTFSPPSVAADYAMSIPDAVVESLDRCGHWHIFEHLDGVTDAVKGFL